LAKNSLQTYKLKQEFYFYAFVYGFENLSLTFRNDYKLRVSEKTVLRMVFGTAKEGISEGWSKLHG
jgi:hypothetical protein